MAQYITEQNSTSHYRRDYGFEPKREQKRTLEYKTLHHRTKLEVIFALVKRRDKHIKTKRRTEH